MQPKIPEDVMEWKENYPCGICGISSLAAATMNSVTDVMAAYERMEGHEYDGHSTVSCLLRVAEELEYPLKRRGTGKSVDYRWPNLESGEVGFAKIQWGNPNDPCGEWHHWAEAMRNSHFVGLYENNHQTLIFCDGNGRWLHRDDPFWSDSYFTVTGDKVTSWYILEDMR